MSFSQPEGGYIAEQRFDEACQELARLALKPDQSDPIIEYRREVR